MEEDSLARKKAELLTGGVVKVSPDFRPPFPLSRSTAGPGAGSVGAVLCFGGTRVKKSISSEEGEFELVERDGGYVLLKGGQEFLDRVELQPTLYHCPEQAFFNLATQCIYSCRFCTSPRLDKRITKDLSVDRILAMIGDAADKGLLKAVAFTSAVVATPQETVDRMAEAVRRTREMLPGIPIGVEPYVDSLDQIDQLRAAGADEIKLNIETFDRELFEKVCGEQDFDWILEAIGHAVEVFGRGKVTSNLIVGMGESDESALEGVEALAYKGCIAILRPLRLNELNRAAMEEAVGKVEPITADRLLRLAREHRAILERHGLDTRTLRTMCQECRCCDLVPFRDL